MIPVCAAHFQGAMPALSRSVLDLPVTDNVRKCVAALPVTAAHPRIFLHAIFPGEVIPRAKELH